MSSIAAKPAGSRKEAAKSAEINPRDLENEAKESDAVDALPIVEVPPAAKGFNLLENAPWTLHPLCRALESMEEQMGLGGRSLSDRLPSMLARQPYANGWTASIVLFGAKNNPSSRFEIAPVSPNDGLRSESIMAYHDGEEANAILQALQALPAFDAHLRQALSQSLIDETQAILSAAAQSKGALAFNGRCEELSGFPSYAEEAIGESEIDIAFAKEAWLALLRAGVPFDAEDFRSAIIQNARQMDDDASDEQRRASDMALAKELFSPVLEADAAAGGSLGSRLSSETEPRLAFLIASAIAYYEADAVEQTAEHPSQKKRRIGIRSGL